MTFATGAGRLSRPWSKGTGLAPGLGPPARMPPEIHPRFEGFFVREIRNGKEGDYTCVLTRHGRRVGHIRTEPGHAMYRSLPKQDEAALLELARRLDEQDHDATGLMLKLLEAAELDPIATRQLIVRTAPDPQYPFEFRHQHHLPLTLTLDDLVGLAHHPHVSLPLTDYYVRHQGWHAIPTAP